MSLHRSLTAALAGLALGVSAWPNPSSYGHSPSWNLQNFESLVIFGDSYSDDSRLNYFGANNGSAPPVGWVDPVNYDAADGGRVWGEYVKQYTGINLYNYAVSGAVCSNDITPRIFSTINANFPAVEQYEVPAYIADSQYVENGTKFLNIPPQSTVYNFWIGTNDIGVYAFLTDSQVPGTNLTSYVDCVFDQVQRVYDNGGRYFVINNIAPLQLSPLYGLPGRGGVGPNEYWPDKPSNITEISERMLEQVVSLNAIYEYRVPFAAEIKRRYPGAHFALFDVYSLWFDIHNNPAQYLNGTAPLNVTGFINHCTLNRTDCVRQSSPDSYFWFDELHPSGQVERVTARTFIDVVAGNSSFATYWGD